MSGKKKFKDVCNYGHPRTPENLNKKGMCKICALRHTKNWQKKNPEKVAALHRRVKYGLSQEAFNQKMESQERKCAVCSRLFTSEDLNSTPHVDHSHVTGENRGLVCHPCNTLLGHAYDDVEILQKAITYLKEEKWKTKVAIAETLIA
jgi:hypothetical protein